MPKVLADGKQHSLKVQIAEMIEQIRNSTSIGFESTSSLRMVHLVVTRSLRELYLLPD